MSVIFDHRDPGTSEDVWAEAAPWDAAAVLSLDLDRLVVLAAHPDDETLGAGGLLACAAERGIPTCVVIVTDGEASHPGSASGRDLRRERRLEVVAALQDLAPCAEVGFLGVPDGGIREHADPVRAHVAARLREGDGHRTLLVAPWWGDDQSDHRVLGGIARELAAAGVRVAGYPIWLWHWGDPNEVVTEGWRVLPLPREATEAKHRAMGRHASQLLPLSPAPGDEAVVHAGMRRHFERPFEVFVDAADTTDTPPPDDFDGRYARYADDPWGFDTRWYERRKRALAAATLPHQEYVRALEIGCATGAFTAVLADRCAEVVGVDVSERALERTHTRLGDAPHVHLARMSIPREWPEGTLELIVLSELGCYWSPADLGRTLDRVERCLDADGALLLSHWRHRIADAPSTGDAVHAAVAARVAFAPAVRHVEEDFLLEVFTRPGALSVARETGQLS